MSRLNELAEYRWLRRQIQACVRGHMPRLVVHDVVRRGLEAREARFVELMSELAVRRPGSLYDQLFHVAGCEPGDIAASVKTRGVEATLRQLRRDEVYLSFAEFKGEGPVVRQGKEISFTEQAWANARTRSAYRIRTGGSSGAPRGFSMNVEFVRANAVHLALILEAVECRKVPSALWLPFVPSGAGINTVLRLAAVGSCPERWFFQVRKEGRGAALRRWWMRRCLESIRSGGGQALPQPEFVPLEEAGRIAAWMKERLEAGGRCLLITYVSSAVRVAQAALDVGMDLTGATCIVAGEALTPGGQKLIRATGCRVLPTYAATEMGTIGCGCQEREECDVIHLFTDAVAMIGDSDGRGWPDPDVYQPDGLYVTTFLRSAPTRLVNVDLGDCGVLRKDRCDCFLGTLGFTTRVHHLRSAQKITIEGMTVHHSTVERLMEQMLPERCGGLPGQYQMSIENRSGGLSFIRVRISPQAGDVDTGRVRAILWRELTRVAPLTARYWRAADTVTVVREEPRALPSGKVPAVYRGGPESQQQNTEGSSPAAGGERGNPH